jgi:hypothetical protein
MSLPTWRSMLLALTSKLTTLTSSLKLSLMRNNEATQLRSCRATDCASTTTTFGP